jgi:hypothetical protein
MEASTTPRKAREPQANIFRREDRFIVHPESRTAVGVWIAREPFLALPVDVTNEELGLAVTAALNQSMESVPHPDRSEWTKVVSPLLKAAQVRSWKAFVLNTMLVCANLRDNTVFFSVCENRGPKEGFAPQEDCEFIAPAGSPTAIGSALREALALTR